MSTLIAWVGYLVYRLCRPYRSTLHLERARRASNALVAALRGAWDESSLDCECPRCYQDACVCKKVEYDSSAEEYDENWSRAGLERPTW